MAKTPSLRTMLLRLKDYSIRQLGRRFFFIEFFNFGFNSLLGMSIELFEKEIFSLSRKMEKRGLLCLCLKREKEAKLDLSF